MQPLAFTWGKWTAARSKPSADQSAQVFAFCMHPCANRLGPLADRRSKLFPLRLWPRETAFFSRRLATWGESVASVLRNGGMLYIKMRGKDGSQKRKEKKTVTRQSYQQGYVSKPIPTRSGRLQGGVRGNNNVHNAVKMIRKRGPLP